MEAIYPALLFVFAIAFLLTGYPVAFSLAGSSLIMAALGYFFIGHFDSSFLLAFPERIYGVMTNETLIAIPLFIFMGILLEKAKIAEDLLDSMGKLFSRVSAGLGISVFFVGALLAASTGIVGATVVSMGLISLPAMLKRNYNQSISAGIICASGTLGQIIPPSIVLVILGDVISSAHQQAQLAMGNWSPESVSVGDLFVGAILPGFVLVLLYMLFLFLLALWKPSLFPKSQEDQWVAGDGKKVLTALIPPFVLILGVLGSILAGLATPTEASSVGCMGALLLAKIKKRLSFMQLKEALRSTSKVNAMVFAILLGASLFSLVFRAYGGDEVVGHFLENLPGGKTASFLLVMSLIFFLGFFLDFFEITFVVVPIVGPILLQMDVDPIWLGVMIALNLQTSFLTPPFGFSLFYLRGVAPESLKTKEIYKGVIPFIAIQLTVMLLLWFFPELVTYLPEKVFS